jgi:hypothetical protein
VTTPDNGHRSASAGAGSVVTAWQQALAAEHQAVFGYSALGPQLAGSAAVSSARADEQAHVQLRDSAIAGLLALAVTPVEPQPNYPLPDLANPAAAARLAVQLETGCAAAWRYLIAVAADPAAERSTLTGPAVHALRQAAQQALTGAATRALEWRLTITPTAPTVAFPGL